MSKKLVMTVLGMSLVAMFATEASARVCTFKSLACAGGCCAWSGSVEVLITADKLGSLSEPKFLVGDLSVLAGFPPDGGGVAVCENKGGTQSPGIQAVDVPGPTDFHVEIQVTKNLVVQNSIVVTLFDDPDPNFLANVDQFCPNPQNWEVIDFAACAMTATFRLTEGSPILPPDGTGTLLSEAVYACTLPSCDTLQFDPAQQKFERRQYDCVLQSVQ